VALACFHRGGAADTRGAGAWDAGDPLCLRPWTELDSSQV